MLSTQQKPDALTPEINHPLISIQNLPQPSPFTIRESFANLFPDTYTAIGKRSRRLSRVTTENNRKLSWLHDASFCQDHRLNNMSGDIVRVWKPLEDYVAESIWLRHLIFQVSDTLGTPVGTTFEIHQFRVFCSSSIMGHPAPEGPHKDGRQYVAIAHIDQCNIVGGITQLYKNLGEAAVLQIRLEPNNLLIFDDRQYFHFTTPIQPFLPNSEGFRDVFILTVPFPQ